mmetsp:Transcript_26805/g.62659  ORF Transcript_26805/g.62659 Transcript_26805/m.62659 type:complete len:524 (-) Transcript_26805:297-1868(-)
MTASERNGVLSLSLSAALMLLLTTFLSVSAAGASTPTETETNGLRMPPGKKQSNKAKLESLVRKQNLLPPLIHEEDLPVENAHEKWVSLNSDVEFLPSDSIDRKIVHRFLEQGNYAYEYQAAGEEESYGGTAGLESIYNVEPFVYGVDEYDEYQQAWRLMGFIVDCYPMVDDDYYQNDGSGSGDQGTEDGCARYVLWAAYVDLEYEGGGIGEYQYWNATQNIWDTTACDASGSSRCAKMDCHQENTHFSLLGFFKHKSYDDWMEQLFKHEGICVWNDEEYAFMKNARKAWPQGCVDSYTTTDSGDEIYYDIKPIQGGDIRVGLYSDTQCIKEYNPSGNDDPITVENILGNFFLANSGSGDDYYYDFSSDSLEDSMARWDSAFGKFRICQPCVAYDLDNADGTKFYDDDNGNAGDMFDCYDDADYTNVNQCMKFMAKTTMNTATFRDMSLGRYQGTLTATQMNGYSGSKSWRSEAWENALTYFFLCIAMAIFLYGAVYFYKAKVATNYQPTFGWANFKEPLVMT